MNQWLVVLSEHAIVVVDMMALLLVAIGTIDAFVRGLLLLLAAPNGHERREVWLRYARWLVAGLTFQLAADIIESSISTGWEGIARLAAVAFVRTFLNYFLEKDLRETRERQRPACQAREPEVTG